MNRRSVIDISKARQEAEAIQAYGFDKYWDTVKETWNSNRMAGAADIQALHDFAEKYRARREKDLDLFQRHGQKENSEIAQRKAVEWRARAAALSRLMNYIARNGHDNVPKHEDLTEHERDKINSWSDVPVEVAAQYGSELPVQKRRLALESLLDNHYPDWDTGRDITKDEKKALQEKLIQQGFGPFELSTIYSDLKILRKIRS